MFINNVDSTSSISQRPSYISIEIEDKIKYKNTFWISPVQVMTALASGADLPANVIIDKEGFLDDDDYCIIKS